MDGVAPSLRTHAPARATVAIFGFGAPSRPWTGWHPEGARRVDHEGHRCGHRAASWHRVRSASPWSGVPRSGCLAPALPRFPVTLPSGHSASFGTCHHLGSSRRCPRLALLRHWRSVDGASRRSALRPSPRVRGAFPVRSRACPGFGRLRRMTVSVIPLRVQCFGSSAEGSTQGFYVSLRANFFHSSTHRAWAALGE